MTKKVQTKIRAELDRIAAKHGGILNPETVVREARSKDSPIHGCFDWNNTRAAQKYRLFQARNLIRVSVEFVEIDEKTVKVRTYVSLKTNRGKAGGYALLAKVLSVDKDKMQLIKDARADYKVFENKYRILTELASLFAAADSIPELN